MIIDKNSRQMPSKQEIISGADYSDLLFAWLQCNSEKIEVGKEHPQRRILKKQVKWLKIENDFSYEVNGKRKVTMGRKTIKKYFLYLIKIGLVEDLEDEYYYLKVMDRGDATLVEYNTLRKLMNVFKNDSITIYCYLLNRYFANGCRPYEFCLTTIKEYLGRSTGSSNNIVITDTLDILQRLGLITYTAYFDHIRQKRQYKLLTLTNKLPD